MFGISGLTYVPSYISAEHHDYLITQIDSSEWDTSLKRRVQHYGYRYDYRARQVTSDMYLGALPKWLTRIAHHLVQDGLIASQPEQVIVNEYQPGQGIAAHVDCEPCFGDRIFSLSLGSSAEMHFTHQQKPKQTLILEPRSMLMMFGSARYDWKHGIPARKSDNRVPRSRRLSLTFRKVTL